MRQAKAFVVLPGLLDRFESQRSSTVSAVVACIESKLTEGAIEELPGQRLSVNVPQDTSLCARR